MLPSAPAETTARRNSQVMFAAEEAVVTADPKTLEERYSPPQVLHDDPPRPDASAPSETSESEALDEAKASSQRRTDVSHWLPCNKHYCTARVPACLFMRNRYAGVCHAQHISLGSVVVDPHRYQG